MAKYIPLDALVAEIEKLKDGAHNGVSFNKSRQSMGLKNELSTWEHLENAFATVLKIINTLEVKDFWKSADGDNLPEYDREVVAFQEIFPTDVDVPSLLKIVIAHRPNPEGYDGKILSTGNIEHYTPKTYDKGGWNIPDIVYWLDVELPKEIEL